MAVAACAALSKFTKANVLPGNTRTELTGPNWLKSSSIASLLGRVGKLPSHKWLLGCCPAQTKQLAEHCLP